MWNGNEFKWTLWKKEKTLKTQPKSYGLPGLKCINTNLDRIKVNDERTPTLISQIARYFHWLIVSRPCHTFGSQMANKWLKTKKWLKCLVTAFRPLLYVYRYNTRKLLINDCIDCRLDSIMCPILFFVCWPWWLESWTLNQPSLKTMAEGATPKIHSHLWCSYQSSFCVCFYWQSPWWIFW